MPGGLVVSFARMNRILELDVRNRRARVQPGLINLDLSRRAAHGIFYAPDPSGKRSRRSAATSATNAGGPHCLSYGTTTNHVLGVEIRRRAGGVIHHTSSTTRLRSHRPAGRLRRDARLVTAVEVRLTGAPGVGARGLAAFADVESASEAVSAIIAAGIVPTALEIMDADHHGGRGALSRRIPARCRARYCWSRSPARARTCAPARRRLRASQRARRALVAQRRRRGRARGAVGVAQGCRGRDSDASRRTTTSKTPACRARKLPSACMPIERIAHVHDLPVGNVFHAGDGNLHPLLMFDRRDARASRAPSSRPATRSCATASNWAERSAASTGSARRNATRCRSSIRHDGSRRDGPRARRLRSARLFNPEKIFPSGARCPEVVPP